MGLTLYRRHRRECLAGHPEDSLTSQLEENRKGWKRCECRIHVSGTLSGRYARKHTGTHVWDEAKQVARAWETSGVWSDAAPPVVDPKPVPADERITIADALSAFLD